MHKQTIFSNYSLPRRHLKYVFKLGPRRSANPIYNLNLNIDFENSLIIHFRGGDSFNPANPNWWKHPPYALFGGYNSS